MSTVSKIGKTSNQPYQNHSGLHCINDFRLFQNQRKLLSLQAWANIIIHKSLPNWATKLKIDQRTLIKNLIAPISQKNIILIEWLSCAQHNDNIRDECATSNMFCLYNLDECATSDMFCLYNLQPYCHQATEKYFDHPALYCRSRYFSKSILFYFYLLHLLEIKKDHVFFKTLSADSAIHLKMHKLLRNVCFIPINQCIETPFIIDKHTAHCSVNDFDINPSEELYTTNKHIFNCRNWIKLHKNKDSKIFSA